MQEAMVMECTDEATARWAELLAKRAAAKTAHEAHTEKVLKPMIDAIERTAPRPDLWFDMEAKSGQVARFFFDTNRLDAWDNHVSPRFREAAASIRTAWLDYAAARVEHDCDAIEAKNEELCAAQGDAEENLVMALAPDVAALLWKLHYLFGADVCWPGGPGPALNTEWAIALMADVEALLGEPAVRP
jgi:hypothetical protein